MELETRVDGTRSSRSNNLVKTVVIGGILGAAAVFLFRSKGILTHTIPPIIIKSVDDGSVPVEVDTRGTLGEASRLSAKTQYKTRFGFGKTVWVEVRGRNSNNQWEGFGFGDVTGLKVQIDLEAENGSSGWVSETAALTVDGKLERFPLLTEALSNSSGNNNRYKRTYKKDKRRRIGKVVIYGLKTPPHEVITSRYKNVEVRFDDHI